MLDKQFLRSFFDQIEACTVEELDAKIAQIEGLIASGRPGIQRGTEAAHDARFMLKHLRRERLERLFNPKPNPAG